MEPVEQISPGFSFGFQMDIVVSGGRGMKDPFPPQARWEFLVRELWIHNWLRYVLETPVLTGHSHDRLIDRLKRLEGRHPELRRRDSPLSRHQGSPYERTNYPSWVRREAELRLQEDARLRARMASSRPRTHASRYGGPLGGAASAT